MKPYVTKINAKRSNFTLYIGREFAGIPASKWQNPFHEYQYGRTRCIAEYERYVRGSNLMRFIHELEDQVLGCWCYPQECHGDVLVKIYKEMCRPGVGDMAQAVNMHGDLMLPAPLLVEYVTKPFTEEWVKLEGQLGLIQRKALVWA